MKTRLIILGMLLNILQAYSLTTDWQENKNNLYNYSLISFPPGIQTVTFQGNSATIEWSPASVIGASHPYGINYTAYLSGNDKNIVKNVGGATFVTFNDLTYGNTYLVAVSSLFIPGGPEYAYFIDAVTSFTVPQEPIREEFKTSLDHTKSPPANVVLKATKRIVLANGFHYAATNGFSLKTQLVPQTKSVFSEEESYTIYPETFYEESSNNLNKATDQESLGNYEIIHKQTSLTVTYKNNNLQNDVIPGNYIISNIMTGQIVKKGSLSTYETNIDIANLSNGVYVISVTNDKMTKSQKFSVK